jgi:hypothetical protein
MLNHAFNQRTNRSRTGIAHQRTPRAAMVEQLEPRTLLSATLGMPTRPAWPTIHLAAIHAANIESITGTATVTATSISFGTENAALLTQPDGLRLLPAGRTTDIPWLGVNKIQITLSAAATLSPSDVSVTGITVANYGPVSITGSGTNYTITLAQPISHADRVTFTIGNAQITTFTRRLDVLPGDANDDGVVNSQDLVVVRNAMASPYNIFADINGDGVVNATDYNAIRPFIGTSLPA